MLRTVTSSPSALILSWNPWGSPSSLIKTEVGSSVDNCCETSNFPRCDAKVGGNLIINFGKDINGFRIAISFDFLPNKLKVSEYFQVDKSIIGVNMLCLCEGRSLRNNGFTIGTRFLTKPLASFLNQSDGFRKPFAVRYYVNQLKKLQWKLRWYAILCAIGVANDFFSCVGHITQLQWSFHPRK